MTLVKCTYKNSSPSGSVSYPAQSTLHKGIRHLLVLMVDQVFGTCYLLLLQKKAASRGREHGRQNVACRDSAAGSMVASVGQGVNLYSHAPLAKHMCTNCI